MKKHGLDIPYVDIRFDKDALIGITLSPTLKLADERSEILKIAKDNGYLNVTADSVCASEIPVRSKMLRLTQDIFLFYKLHLLRT